MHVVALTRLGQDIDAALGPVAALLGSSAYELRLVLNAGLPAVVLVTDDQDRASHAVAGIERLGHAATTCDRARVTPSAKMTAIRVIAFGADRLSPTESGSEQLPYADVSCLLRATHAVTTETVGRVTERKLRPGMALATGGLILSKTTTREVRSSHEDRQQVVYVFRRSGARPFILRERETNYAGLATKLSPSSMQNFATAIAELRARMPRAVYDEALVRPRPVRGVPAGIESMDVSAHLLAAHYGRART